MSNDPRTTALPAALTEAGIKCTLTQRVLREKAINGAYPAYQGSDHIWRFRRADLPAIAKALGLTSAAEPAAASTDQRAA